MTFSQVPALRRLAALRAIPVDAIAFVVIAIGMILSRVVVIRHNLCFNDPSWYFHFGRKTLHGAVPYRDYVFQVGPLPIYVDALFQRMFGERYVASLYAGLFITTLRVSAMWLLGRRLAGTLAAAALALFCALDPLFSYAHHWSTPYAELFFTVTGLCLVRAVDARPRATLIYLALAGLCAALVVSARQSSAVTIAFILACASTVMLVRGDYFTPRRFVALWAGFLAGLVLVFGALALQGALGPAIQQMFLDAGQKKNISAFLAILDALTGGAMVDGTFTSPWYGFLFYLGLPTAIVIGICYCVSRCRDIPARTVASIAVPGAVVLGLAMRYAQLAWVTDLPRTFLTAITAVAIVVPDRCRRWFGVEPIVAVGLAGMPLASDWALEMSFLGRGWGDIWALVTGGILISLASGRVARPAKTVFCCILAAAAIINTWLLVRADLDPFAKPEARDGTLKESEFSPRGHDGQRIAMLRAVHLVSWRADAISWLTKQVTPGSTCFVYGNLPSLYDLVDCTNPTLLDDTIADFPSPEDAERAVAALKAHPPDFLLAHDRMWMSPAISYDLGGDIGRYDSWNPRASFALHMGLRSIIDQYESLGTVGEALGAGPADVAAHHWDAIDAIHVYRRKR